MKLLAVCVGQVAPLIYRTASGEVKTITSGIKKSAISQEKNPMTVEVKKLGVQNDEQCNLSVHGGIDKAVYMMPAEHYDFWNQQRKKRGLEGNLPWGFLGENLVIEGLTEKTVHLGDEIDIGSVRMQVTEPREPCFKFAIRMGYGQAPKQMVQTGNCGWYLKVVEPGYLKAGDPIIWRQNGAGATVDAFFRKISAKGQLDLL